MEEGGAGARVMMNEGLFKLFPCQAVFALHNWPHLPQGQMGTKIGPIMASGVTLRSPFLAKVDMQLSPSQLLILCRSPALLCRIYRL